MTPDTAQSPEGITLLGAEMLTWSDADGEVGEFGGLLAPHLLAPVLSSAVEAGRRVLIAGPTTAAVILDVAARFAAADILVRSWPDAQRLRSVLPESVGVICGPLDRLVAGGARYDTVVAVAGIDRLHSAEEETPAAAAVLGDLAGLVADAGELYVGIGNQVGVDRLVSLGSDSRHHDADWPTGHVVAGEQVLGVDAAVDLLAGEHGLSRVETWFCHGRRSDPLLAAPAVTLTGRATDPVLLREVGRAYDVADPSAPALKDPAATVRDLVRAGLGAATAPLAVLHLRRGGAAEITPADGLLVCEPVHDGSPAVAYRLTPGTDGWQRTLLGDPASFAVSAGLSRDTARLVGPLPGGDSLAAMIETCCAAHDATAAGQLVRRYRDWLGDAPDTLVPPDRVPLVPRLLAVTPDGLAAVDRSWSAEGSAPRDVVLVRGLLDLAADLLGRGVRHPWSPAASARVLATSLAAAAGIEWDELPLAAALELDARLRPAAAVPDYEAPGNAGRLSYAELAELADGLARRAADGDEHVIWLLRRLQGRQRALRRTRGHVHALETSREMWIGRRVFVLRSLLRRWRQRREERANGPKGEWRDRSGEVNEEQEILEIESNLIPPGYQPPPEITVVPPED